MPWYTFIWNEELVEHLAEHDVSVEEFEEIVSNPDVLKRSRSSQRPLAIGVTTTGRKLACVFEYLDSATILPVTAYEID